MRKPALPILVFALLIASVAWARDKNQSLLPASVLHARTVAVIIDPAAGIDLEDPRANETAQRDVEAALLNWGRFDPRISTEGADLVIVVRRGHARLVQDTIADPRQNNRPGSITPSDNGISIGAQHGQQQQNPADASNPQNNSPQSQMEIGQQQDTFTVYQGGVDDSLDSPPAWRYIAKDGLHPHDVPAVDAFRKAIAEAEKKAAKHP